jgi:hypothetical protein
MAYYRANFTFTFTLLHLTIYNLTILWVLHLVWCNTLCKSCRLIQRYAVQIIQHFRIKRTFQCLHCYNFLLFFITNADQDFATYITTKNQILASLPVYTYSRQEAVLFYVQFVTTNLNLRNNKSQRFANKSAK